MPNAVFDFVMFIFNVVVKKCVPIFLTKIEGLISVMPVCLNY